MNLSTKTVSGRHSRTKLFHRVMIALQGLNVSFWQAVGLDASTALIVSTLLGVFQSVAGDYLRSITDEPMGK